MNHRTPRTERVRLQQARKRKIRIAKEWNQDFSKYKVRTVSHEDVQRAVDFANAEYWAAMKKLEKG